MTRRLSKFVWCGAAAVMIWTAPVHGFIANDRWGSTATDGPTGAWGSPVTVTWSIVPDGTTIPYGSSTTGSSLVRFLDANFGSGPGGNDYTQRPWFPIFQQSFDRLSALSGVTYVYEPNDDGVRFANNNSGNGLLGVRGDVRIAGRTYGEGSNTLASNYFPNYGEMIINTDKSSFFRNSANGHRAFRNTIMHEAMHGLGISHVESSNARFLIEPTLSTAFDGPQLDDLLAIQRLYGDVYEKGGGNDVAATATPLGLITGAGRVIGSRGDSTIIAAADVDFLSIDDDSDVDYFSFTLQESLDVSLSVLPKGTTYSVGPQDGVQTSFNTQALSDLALSLFGADGSTLLASANVNGIGLGESIFQTLAPGAYYARVSGSQNNIQLYQLSIAATPTGPANLVWVGNAEGFWDIEATANFKNGSTPDRYSDGDSVAFDDTSSHRLVNIVSDVAPSAIVVDASGSYVFDGEGGIVGGSLRIEGAGVVELRNNGNSYAGATTIVGGVLKITGDANAMVSELRIGPGAKLVLDAVDASAMQSLIRIQEGGTLEIGSLATDADVFPDNPAGVANYGTIRILDGERIANMSGSGQVYVDHESSTFEDNANFDGRITIGSSAELRVGNAAGLGSVAGETVVESGGSVLIDADVALAEPLALTGDGAGLGALRVAPGRIATLAGAVTLSGPGAHISIGSGSLIEFQGLIDGSPVDADLSLVVAEAAMLRASGAIALNEGGVIKRGTGAAELVGVVDYRGDTRVEQGELSLAGDGLLEGHFGIADEGRLQIAGSHAFSPEARLEGQGMVEGDVVMPGTIVGDSHDGLTFAGNLTLQETSRVQWRLGEAALQTDYQPLSVGETAALDGIMEVILESGYAPASGDVFRILAAGNIVGAFDAYLFPELPHELTWQLSILPQEIFLAVVAATEIAAADFNADGAVDGYDLALWQTNFGISGNPATGDADRDQTVDGRDFLIWQRQFSANPAAASVAAPEPGASVLVLWATLMLATAGRRGKQ